MRRLIAIGDNPIAKAFNKATKYVVTRTLDQFDWENSLHK